VLGSVQSVDDNLQGQEVEGNVYNIVRVKNPKEKNVRIQEKYFLGSKYMFYIFLVSASCRNNYVDSLIYYLYKNSATRL
jgi:hypothetical protein